MLKKKNKKKTTKCTLDQLVQLCVEAKNAHKVLMHFKPVEEAEKQNMWFAAKKASWKNAFIANVDSLLKTK